MVRVTRCRSRCRLLGSCTGCHLQCSNSRVPVLLPRGDKLQPRELNRKNFRYTLCAPGPFQRSLQDRTFCSIGNHTSAQKVVCTKGVYLAAIFRAKHVCSGEAQPFIPRMAGHLLRRVQLWFVPHLVQCPECHSFDHSWWGSIQLQSIDGRSELRILLHWRHSRLNRFWSTQRLVNHQTCKAESWDYGS